MTSNDSRIAELMTKSLLRIENIAQMKCAELSHQNEK